MAPVRPWYTTLVFSSTKIAIVPVSVSLSVDGLELRHGAQPASSTTLRAAFEHRGLHLEGIAEVRLEDRPPLVGVGAVEADDDRGVDVTRPSASTMPLATSSPRVMPPKMLMKMDLTVSSLLMTSRAPAITSASGPAADVEEVGRRCRRPG